MPGLAAKVALGSAALAASAVLYADRKIQLLHDLSVLKNLGPFSQKMAQLKAMPDWTVADMWEEAVSKHAEKDCLHFEGNTMTYAEVDRAACRVASWALARGLNQETSVAIFIENRPTFVIMLMGFAKVGVKVALINTTIKQKGLLHCIKQSAAKLVVFGLELSAPIEAVKAELEADGVSTVSVADSVSRPASPAADEDCSAWQGGTLELPQSYPWKKHRGGLNATSTFAYIYTSGTTGLPKAAIIQHIRMFTVGGAFGQCFSVTSDDVVYGSGMPLYHTAAGLGGLGMTFEVGCSFVISRKFSASKYWDVARQHKVTVVLYIGELARYLVAAAPQPDDASNTVRIAIGSGMRPEVWSEFITRFGVPEIGELYGSTEGTAFIFNHHKGGPGSAGIGACGHMGPILRRLMGVKIAKFDVATELPIRDPKTGYCIPTSPGEPGELLGEIKDPKAFAGYTNKKATESKILRDVFAPGDMYFRTGDLLKMDAEGYLYFIDRCGDTFRWKGENVSTNEVSDVCSSFQGILEANAYGVEIPGADGRACAVALGLMPGEELVSTARLKAFAAHVNKALPSYAVPLFLRVQGEIALTATFKHTKVKLRSEGADPSKVNPNDTLLYLSPKSKTYEPLDTAAWARISTGQAKL